MFSCLQHEAGSCHSTAKGKHTVGLASPDNMLSLKV